MIIDILITFIVGAIAGYITTSVYLFIKRKSKR